MDGVTPSNQPQQNPKADSSGNQQHITEKQADDFAKRVGKKKNEKGEAKSGEKEASLESLFAARSAKKDKAHKEHLESIHQRKQHTDKEAEHGQSGEKTEQPAYAVRDTMASSQTSQVKGIEAITAPKEVNEVINKLVDRIHVSAKDSVNGSEIRITMKENILPGTEIRIQRMGGELTVTMNTTNSDTHNFLAVNESSLAKSLNERFGDKVQVNINLSSGDQPDDGRSREQYQGEQDDDEG